jgi:hypothetical protein
MPALLPHDTRRRKPGGKEEDMTAKDADRATRNNDLPAAPGVSTTDSAGHHERFSTGGTNRSPVAIVTYVPMN